jgi:hypothetical protein
VTEFGTRRELILAQVELNRATWALKRIAGWSHDPAASPADLEAARKIATDHLKLYKHKVADQLSLNFTETSNDQTT